MQTSFNPIKRTSLIPFTGILFFLLSQTILAQNTGSPDSLKIYGLNEVVITGTRSEVEQSKVPQKIDVITSKEIQQTSAQEFTDVLKKNASVDIIQYPGLLSGVGIRGFRPQTGSLNQRALLLVDGRPAGTTNLSMIDVSSIAQVEVLKGPGSALYGSQAMGGVVNIITKKSRGPVRTSLFAEYGSFQTFKMGVATGGNLTKNLDFDLSFSSYDRSDNYKLGTGNLFRKALGGEKAIHTFADGSTRDVADSRADGTTREFTRLNYYSGAVRLGYQVTKQWRVDVRGERFAAPQVESPSDVAVGNASPSTKDLSRYNGEVSVTGDFAHHQVSVRGYTAEEISDNNTLTDIAGQRISPYLSFHSEARWQGVQVKDVLRIKQHTTVTFGLDYTNATTTSRAWNNDSTERAPYSPNYTLGSTGIYAQGHFSLLAGKLLIQPGLRYDFINYNVKRTPLLDTYAPGKETNPFVSPSLGVQYQLLEAVTAYATVGRAFVTPDAYNVAGYSQIGKNKAVAVTVGNPDLKNENSITWDAGLSFAKPALGITADVTYFSTRVKDKITRKVSNPTTTELTASGDTIKSVTSYVNVNKGEIEGLEAELGFDLGALNEYAYSLRLFAGSTSMFKAQDIIKNSDGSESRKGAYNVTRFNTSFGVSYDNFKWLNVRLTGRYVGHRKDTDFNDPASPQIEYPAFMVVDVAASYTFQHKHVLTVFVNNVTDENYYEKRGYNLPGRNVALRYSFSF